MSALEERLRLVEDRLAIIDLEGRYARSFDDRDGDTWSSLFTKDGIYQSRVQGETNSSFVQGTENLRRYCADSPYTGLHLLHLPEIRLDGDKATSRIHLEFFGAFDSDGRPRLQMAGYYDVQYVRPADQWLIKRRVTTAFARTQVTVFGYRPGSGLADAPPADSSAASPVRAGRQGR